MAAPTLDILSPLLGGWTRVQAPTAEHPYWRDAEAGTRLDVHDVLADQRPAAREQAVDAHIEAVADLLREAWQLHPIRQFTERRRLITAAGRLCDEFGGWRPAANCEPAP
jgi:hypothetical protein